MCETTGSTKAEEMSPQITFLNKPERTISISELYFNPSNIIGSCKWYLWFAYVKDSSCCNGVKNSANNFNFLATLANGNRRGNPYTSGLVFAPFERSVFVGTADGPRKRGFIESRVTRVVARPIEKFGLFSSISETIIRNMLIYRKKLTAKQPESCINVLAVRQPRKISV